MSGELSKSELLAEIQQCFTPQEWARILEAMEKGKSLTVELVEGGKDLQQYREKAAEVKSLFEQTAAESILASDRPGNKGLGPLRSRVFDRGLDGGLIAIAVEAKRKEIQSDRMYSPEEAAYVLGVHVKTILRWVQEGGIKSFGFGGRMHRIRGADLLGMK